MPFHFVKLLNNKKFTAMIIAYVRVSTGKQNLENQKEEIRKFASEKGWNVDKWVEEVVSGAKNKKCRKLGALLKRMKKGDVLIVTEISRLSRTLTEIMAIMGQSLKKGINIYTTKERYTFDDTINSKVLCFAFGLVAEIERNLISMRTREALALRKSEGVCLGRRKGSTSKIFYLQDNRTYIEMMLAKGYSKSRISRELNVSRETLYKFIRMESVEKKRIREGGLSD